VISFAV
jgi:hypothetical protein